MPELTVENVIGLATVYATLHPDATYKSRNGEQCMYTDGELAGKTGCLFGQVLQELGVPFDTLKEFDSVDGRISIGIINVLSQLGLKPNEEQSGILSIAQCSQDAGVPLGRIFKNE